MASNFASWLTVSVVSVSESTYSMLTDVVVDAGVAQRLIERLVRIRQLGVLAAHGDGDLALGVLDLVDQRSQRFRLAGLV
jgi:phage replication-related protein YjqB (UPF0714/DUF867 family)